MAVDLLVGQGKATVVFTVDHGAYSALSSGLLPQELERAVSQSFEGRDRPLWCAPGLVRAIQQVVRQGQPRSTASTLGRRRDGLEARLCPLERADDAAVRRRVEVGGVSLP